MILILIHLTNSAFQTKDVFLPKMRELRRGYFLTISSLAGEFSRRRILPIFYPVSPQQASFRCPTAPHTVLARRAWCPI